MNIACLFRHASRRLHSGLVRCILLTASFLLGCCALHAQIITTGTVDAGSGPGGQTGQYTSQAVVNGNPAIGYYDVTNGDLKYVRANDANGTSWGTPVNLDSTGNVGQFISLAVVNGNPAISYYDFTNSDLKYVRALDANGTSWGTPVTLDSAGSVGYFTSLLVVNGNPAISYFDNTNGDLKYMRANDASGTSWGTPVSPDSTGIVGIYTSLAVVNGNPAISYLDASGGDLKYVRALDSIGTGWGTPVTLDSTGNVGSFSSLVVVAGNPAISYYDLTNGDLKYVRALDAGGTGWGTPVALDTAIDSGRYCSLAVVTGNPAISYYDLTNGDLKYVRALDAGGTNWSTPLTVDGTGDVGQYTSLAVVNGNPSISYYDVTNGDLKWATISPYPEIVVEQPAGNSLNDGVSTKDFGTVTVNSGPVVATFKITNTGTANLTGLAVTLDGANAGDFGTTQPGSTTLVPGASAFFNVSFIPTVAGARSAAIHIASNVAGAKNPFDIALTGTGQTVFQLWAAANGVANDPNANGANGQKNVVNFAFGIHPVTGTSAALKYTGTLAGGGTITAPGMPVPRLEPTVNTVDFRALYVRRKDYATAGLTYVVEFSAALSTWSASAVTPTVLADDGTNQIVSVPFPAFPGGMTQGFFRVNVTLAP